MSDNINATDARRIYEDCRIASDNIDAILNETTSAYVSRRYIREKLENVEYAVKFIRSVVEEDADE